MWWKHKGEEDELVELHRKHAALVNNHMHHDLKDMPAVERQVAINTTLDEIEQEQMFRAMPWLKALSKAVRKSIFK